MLQHQLLCSVSNTVTLATSHPAQLCVSQK